MAIVTGDRYLESLVKFVESHAEALIEGTLTLKLNPVGLHYVHSRLEALQELEGLIAGAPIDYLRAYVSDLGDHRALEQLRRILRLLPALKVVSVLPHPARDPTPLPLLPFGRLRVLELRGCDLSTSAAKGLLELRHTLEKIICHDSTDALRHVFASRIAEIKDSPQWKRLTFVSCACNNLVLMDESLQLLPAVETVDLSRNKFTKVDNLRKCTKLKHLDLGFNHLRTVASLSEVSSHIVKLVLRNNALPTLRGIENLKSLEGLDLSYNVISNFLELEILVGLPSLVSLWLEGNPLCCARWYRAHVFSFLNYPDKVKLDEKGISTREFWKRKIIVASRQKRPASYGFYSPAQDVKEGEGTINIKQKKLSRLACIESGEESLLLCSDQESMSCDNDIRSRGEQAVSDDEAEITEFMNKVELMKKERSVLWLRELKEWMDQPCEDLLGCHEFSCSRFISGEQNCITNNYRTDIGQSSKYVSGSGQTSKEDNNTSILESENSVAAVHIGSHALQHSDQFGEAASRKVKDSNRTSVPFMDGEQLKSCRIERDRSVVANKSNPDTMGNAHFLDAVVCSTSFTAIDDIMESHSSCGCSSSPPHFQENILHRRQNLVQEFLQLSADSLSPPSSESCTSESENETCESELSAPNDVFNGSMDSQLNASLNLSEDICIDGVQQEKGTAKCILDSHDGIHSANSHPLKPEDCLQVATNVMPGGVDDCEGANSVKQYSNGVQKEQRNRKPKRRVVSLLEENNFVGKPETSDYFSRDPYISTYNGDDKIGTVSSSGSDCYLFTGKNLTWINKTVQIMDDNLEAPSGVKQSSFSIDDYMMNYFNTKIRNPGVNEICQQYMRCECILVWETFSQEREVALFFSSEQKLYVLLIDVMLDGSGTMPTVVGCQKLGDVQEVLVGLGLQVVSLQFAGDVLYLFITKDIEKSTQLLGALDFWEPSSIKWFLRSLELVQVELFAEQICGGSKKSIFQYSLVLFFQSCNGEELWLSRSLFMAGGHVFVCIEDFMQFGSLSSKASSSPYYLLDSCCSTTDVSEMVIETRESPCVTLALEYAWSDPHCTTTADTVKTIKGLDRRKAVSSSARWKIKWFSEDSLFRFVGLLKASRAGATRAPLRVRCIS